MKFRLEVSLQNRQKKVQISSARVILWVKRILRALHWSRVRLDVLVVNDRQMQKIHRKFLRENSPTDVMAFGPARRFFRSRTLPFLGSIVVSAETAYRVGPQWGHSGDQELLLYACHGMLHLMGERDDTPRRKARMHAMQEKVLSKLLGKKWQLKKQKRLF